MVRNEATWGVYPSITIPLFGCLVTLGSFVQALMITAYKRLLPDVLKRNNKNNSIWDTLGLAANFFGFFGRYNVLTYPGKYFRIRLSHEYFHVDSISSCIFLHPATCLSVLDKTQWLYCLNKRSTAKNRWTLIISITGSLDRNFESLLKNQSFWSQNGKSFSSSFSLLLIFIAFHGPIIV